MSAPQSTDQYPNAEHMAFPVQGSEYAGALYPEKGLTKRELFAAMAMQGMCTSTPADTPTDTWDMESLATSAIEAADALLAALAKDAT